MSHNFDYENADRKDLLERCKRFEIAVDAQHALCMETFKERDTYRELCGELLAALKLVNDEHKPSYHDCTDDGKPECEWCLSKSTITKAEKILGENNGTSN